MVRRFQYPYIVRVYILIFWFFLNPLSIEAQELIRIIENGEEIAISEELRSKLNKTDSEERVLLKSWYSSRGYFNASIIKTSQNYFKVEKGCQFVIEDIRVNKSVGSFGTRIIGEYYSDAIIEDHINGVLKVLEQQGFLFSRVEIESIQPDINQCQVSVSLTITEGKKWLTSKILFPGAAVNKPGYLRKISGFKDSLLITQSLFEELQSNLRQSELFEEVFTPEVFLEDNKAVIAIAVRERNLNQFDGLLGYVPDQNGNGQLVGDFELSLWNVLNQGNGIDLEYQRLRPETTRLNIGISQDWFGSLPFGAGFNFNLYQNDTTYQTRNLSLDAYYLISRSLRITGEVGQVSSTSSNTTLLLKEPDGKKQYAELGFRYSTLDNIDVPTRGIRLSVNFGVADKNVEIDSLRSFSQQYIKSNVSYYVPIFSKTVLAISAEAFLLNANKSTENDLIRFGGANSFRGYAEEQFEASRLVWGDLEYRFLVNRFSYLFAFVSAGGYHRPKLLTEADNTFRASDFLYSTGFGVSYKVRIGRLKFAYAISPEGELGNGKVHIGIITSL